MNFEWDHIQSSSCLVPILYRSGLTYYYHTFFSACLPSHSSFPANKHICKIRTGSSPIKALNTGVIYKLRDFGRHRAGCHRWTRPDVKFMRADIATATQVSHIFLRREKLSPEKKLPSWNFCLRQRPPPPMSHICFLTVKKYPGEKLCPENLLLLLCVRGWPAMCLREVSFGHFTAACVLVSQIVWSIRAANQRSLYYDSLKGEIC